MGRESGDIYQGANINVLVIPKTNVHIVTLRQNYGEADIQNEENSPFANLITESYFEALRLIRQYDQSLLPIENTVFVESNSRGEYHGKIGSAHYISFASLSSIIPNFPPRITDRVKRQMTKTMVHELLHQRHAEIVTVGNWLGYTGEQMNRRRNAATIEEALKSLNDRSNDPDNLAVYIKEGIAYEGAALITHNNGGDSFTAPNIRAMELIRKIMKNSHLTIEDLMRKIDIAKCREIPSYSGKFLEILTNPSLIPGLEYLAS